MATTTVELTRDEIVERGKEIYERDVRALLESLPGNMTAAIDVRTGEFEIGADAIESGGKLRARIPDAVIFFRRRYPVRVRWLSASVAPAARPVYS